MDRYSLVEEIHKTPTKAVIIAAGGGSEVFPTLLRKGGGSRTLIAGYTPYSANSTIELLGAKPDQFCSEQTARALAMAAYQKALKLKDADCPVIGVAVTCSLQGVPTERAGRAHRIYAALQTASSTVTHSWIDPNTRFADETNTRLWEEEIASNMVLDLLAEGCGIQQGTNSKYEVNRKGVESLVLGKLLSGELKRIALKDTVYFENLDSPKALLPGSFNPAHKGHFEMATVAEKFVGGRCDFELSLLNVDKPALDFITVLERLETFGNDGRIVWLTNAPLFTQKAQTFPNTVFAVGHDTLVRIGNPKYAGDIEMVKTTLAGFGALFLVFGRNYGEKGFQNTLDEVPDTLKGMCHVVDEKMFFRDISSTEIRKAAQNGDDQGSATGKPV